MKIAYSIKNVLIREVLLGGFLFMSGCIMLNSIPAPKRNFFPQDLLIPQDELPPEWSIAFGPSKAGDNDKPSNSMKVGLKKLSNVKLKEDMKWEVLELIYPFSSNEGAKKGFKLDAGFPGDTNIEGWTFSSSLANEQKFSCYTYSNMDYPRCTWVARYEEIEVQVFGWIDPERMKFGEFQNLVEKMDERISQYLKP